MKLPVLQKQHIDAMTVNSVTKMLFFFFNLTPTM